MPGDVTVQTTAILANARELLDAAGLELSHVVSARVFLTDLADFDAMNRVYRAAFRRRAARRARRSAPRLTGPVYKVEMTFVASAGPRRVVRGEGAPNPNLSAAIVAGDSAYLSGLLPDAAVVASGDAVAQARDVVGKIDRLLGACGMAARDVRDLLVYVTDEEAAHAAVQACRAAFGAARGDHAGARVARHGEGPRRDHDRRGRGRERRATTTSPRSVPST